MRFYPWVAFTGIVLIATSCGYEIVKGDKEKPHRTQPVPVEVVEDTSHDDCTITETPKGTLISCPDGSSSLIKQPTDGKDGAVGKPGAKGDTGETGASVEGPKGDPGIIGPPGKDGYSCTTTQTDYGSHVACEDDSYSDIMNGTPGFNGTSCTVIQNDFGAAINCDDGTSAVVLNGLTGAAGPQGTSGTNAIYEIIDPCGDDPNHVDEVLLRLNSGDLIAWYRDVGLFNFDAGSWVTTDHQRCNFTVTSNGEVQW